MRELGICIHQNSGKLQRKPSQRGKYWQIPQSVASGSSGHGGVRSYNRDQTGVCRSASGSCPGPAALTFLLPAAWLHSLAALFAQKKNLILTLLLLFTGFGTLISGFAMLGLGMTDAHWGIMFGITGLTWLPGAWQAHQLREAYYGRGYVQEI